jgi:beta-lactamase class A
VIADVFAEAGAEGFVHACEIGTDHEFAFGADDHGEAR